MRTAMIVKATHVQVFSTTSFASRPKERIGIVAGLSRLRKVGLDLSKTSRLERLVDVA